MKKVTISSNLLRIPENLEIEINNFDFGDGFMVIHCNGEFSIPVTLESAKAVMESLGEKVAEKKPPKRKRRSKKEMELLRQEKPKIN